MRRSHWDRLLYTKVWTEMYIYLSAGIYIFYTHVCKNTYTAISFGPFLIHRDVRCTSIYLWRYTYSTPMCVKIHTLRSHLDRLSYTGMYNVHLSIHGDIHIFIGDLIWTVSYTRICTMYIYLSVEIYIFYGNLM